MIIILTLFFLVALNFILLFFSCNKISKKETAERPNVIENIISHNIPIQKVAVPKVKVPKVTEMPSAQLAPTGS